MKNKHLLSLLQKGYTTIQVFFQDHGYPAAPTAPPAPAQAQWRQPEAGPRDHQTQSMTAPRAIPRAPCAPAPGHALYTYKARGQIAVGDRVVVESRTGSGLAIAVVHSVDPAPRIDVDSDLDYKWIVQRVDLDSYAKILDQEQAFADQLQEVERQHQRDELTAKMTAHLPEGSAARKLFDDAVANFGGGVAVAYTGDLNGETGQHPVEETRVAGVACK